MKEYTIWLQWKRKTQCPRIKLDDSLFKFKRSRVCRFSPWTTAASCYELLKSVRAAYRSNKYGDHMGIIEVLNTEDSRSTNVSSSLDSDRKLYRLDLVNNELYFNCEAHTLLLTSPSTDNRIFTNTTGDTCNFLIGIIHRYTFITVTHFRNLPRTKSWTRISRKKKQLLAESALII